MAATFTFDGQQVTVAEVAARFTCYSRSWLAEALKAGCRSSLDLSRYYQQGRMRQRRQLRPMVQGRRPLKN
jgi:hypothetical protein